MLSACKHKNAKVYLLWMYVDSEVIYAHFQS